MRLLLLVALIAIPAGAQDPELVVLRLAMEAHIRRGNALLAKGDVDGASKAYNDAIGLLEYDDPDDRTAVSAGGLLRPVQRAERRARAHVRTRAPIEMGLAWLAKHQDVDEDGRWDSDGYHKHDPRGVRYGWRGGPLYDVGVTSLALLAFFGAGYTDRGSKHDNPYAKNVRMGLRYLVSTQDKDGCFGTRESQRFIYNHAFATLAMCEAYWMTGSRWYRKPAQAGLYFLFRARNPHLGWRYGVRPGENDTSVTALCVMALKSGRFGGLDVDADAFDGARMWIDKMTDPATGRVGYNTPGGLSSRPPDLEQRFRPERAHAMTAAAIFARVLIGEDPADSVPIRRGVGFLAASPPRWGERNVDMYYWFMGTLAMRQVGGPAWKTWNKALIRELVEHQHPPGGDVMERALAGSWDPIGPWGREGGQIYSTALMTMCLQVYYRYNRVFR